MSEAGEEKVTTQRRAPDWLHHLCRRAKIMRSISYRFVGRFLTPLPMPQFDAPIDPVKLLPHAFPFLLVDRISVAEPGRRVVGTKLVTGGEWSLVGSSKDGKSMQMPHLLIVEALAQVSAALFVSLLAGSGDVIGYFMALDRVRFRGQVVAGDELSLSVSLKQFRRGVCKTRGVARVGALQVVQAELTTVLRSASA